MNRRNALAGVSAAALLVGCTSLSGNANAQAVFAAVQYFLPLVETMAIGISIAVPQSAAIVTTVAPYLDKAGLAFQALSATMTQVQAQPIVQQVEAYGRGAVDQIATLVNTAPPGSALAKFAPEVAKAQAVLALLTVFVNGAMNIPKAAMAPVALPLLHR